MISVTNQRFMILLPLPILRKTQF